MSFISRIIAGALCSALTATCNSPAETEARGDKQARSAKVNTPQPAPIVQMNDSVALSFICSGKRAVVRLIGMGPNRMDTASVDTTWTWKVTSLSELKKRYPRAKYSALQPDGFNVDYTVRQTTKQDSLYVVAYEGIVPADENSGDLGNTVGIISFVKRKNGWVLLSNRFDVISQVGQGKLRYQYGGWIGTGGVHQDKLLTAVLVPENDDDRILLFDQYGNVNEDASLAIAMRDYANYQSKSE